MNINKLNDQIRYCDFNVILTNYIKSEYAFAKIHRTNLSRLDLYHLEEKLKSPLFDDKVKLTVKYIIMLYFKWTKFFDNRPYNNRSFTEINDDFCLEPFFDQAVILTIDGFTWYTQLEMFEYMLEQKLLDILTLKQFSYCLLHNFQSLIDKYFSKN